MLISMDQIKRRLESAAQRAEAVRVNIDRLEGNLQEIEAERSDLEAACRVFNQLKEDGDEANGAASGTNGARELTQRALITMILKEADHPMKPAEIVAVALEKHRRKIPSGTIHGNLYRWKKEGRVINSNIGWSLTPPISSSSNPQPLQPERTDPVERSDADDLDS